MMGCENIEYLFHPTQANINLHQLHFIIPDYPTCNVFKTGIKKSLKKFGYTSAILSFIGSDKHECITKEKYDEMYKTNEESEKRMDLSVGEDLETFIEKIKIGKINISWKTDRSETFLLCLLDGAERRKLEQKDQAFMEKFFNHHLEKMKIPLWEGVQVDVPEAEWKASESNLKFASYRCRRKTYFIAV